MHHKTVFNRNPKGKEAGERLDKLESEFRSLKLEWLEVYDKIHKLYHRLNQRDRYQRDKVAAQDANGDEGVVGPARAIDKVSQRILARRRGINAVSPPGAKPPGG